MKKIRKAVVVVTSGALLTCICVFGMVLFAPKNGAPASTQVAGVAAATNTAAPTVVNTATPSRCVPASERQIEVIREGIKDVDKNNDIKSAWAVKSEDFEDVWMVAAKIYGTGMEEGTGPGVWAISGDPDKPGMTLSVDGFAKEFSSWPDGSKTSAKVGANNDGVDDAKLCYGKAVVSPPALALTRELRITPTYLPSHPAGTSGQCKDGTYTKAKHKQGACSSHGGVREWWGP